MHLTLLRDGDKGNPLGQADISDSPDAGELEEALSGIQEQAQEVLDREREEAEIRQQALAVPAEEAAQQETAAAAKASSEGSSRSKAKASS
jgi:hypothetical protein